MNNAECVFCKVVTGQIPVTKIYENQDVLAFLDIGPVSDGHTLVVPKQHFEKLHDCPSWLLAQVASSLGKIAKAMVNAMNFQGYNILCNNDRTAGQLVSHLHFHIIGRKAGDNLFSHWPAYKYKDDKIEQIAVKIRKKL